MSASLAQAFDLYLLTRVLEGLLAAVLVGALIGPLLYSIFNPDAPGHDAVLIEDGHHRC